VVNFIYFFGGARSKLNAEFVLHLGALRGLMVACVALLNWCLAGVIGFLLAAILGRLIYLCVAIGIAGLGATGLVQGAAGVFLNSVYAGAIGDLLGQIELVGIAVPGGPGRVLHELRSDTFASPAYVTPPAPFAVVLGSSGSLVARAAASISSIVIVATIALGLMWLVHNLRRASGASPTGLTAALPRIGLVVSIVLHSEVIARLIRFPVTSDDLEESGALPFLFHELLGLTSAKYDAVRLALMIQFDPLSPAVCLALVYLLAGLILWIVHRIVRWRHQPALGASPRVRSATTGALRDAKSRVVDQVAVITGSLLLLGTIVVVAGLWTPMTGIFPASLEVASIAGLVSLPLVAVLLWLRFSWVISRWMVIARGAAGVLGIAVLGFSPIGDVFAAYSGYHVIQSSSPTITLPKPIERAIVFDRDIDLSEEAVPAPRTGETGVPRFEDPETSPPPVVPRPVAARSLASSPSRVTIDREGPAYRYRVNGQQELIRGMGYNPTFASRPRQERRAVMERDFRFMRQIGVNTIVGWSVAEFDSLLLDVAHEQGLGVVMPFELNPDANYGDERVRRDLTNDVLAWVERYRGHPALRMWGIGNEVMLNMRDRDRPRAFAEFYANLVLQVRAADPGHPVLYREAEDAQAFWIQGAMLRQGGPPPGFVYGMNYYTFRMRDALNAWPKRGFDVPIFVAEFGTAGVPRHERPAAIERMWNILRDHRSLILGGAVYVWSTEGPEPVDRLFGIVNAEAEPVDGTVAALKALYHGQSLRDASLATAPSHIGHPRPQ
jgi:hypothetical protein